MAAIFNEIIRHPIAELNYFEKCSDHFLKSGYTQI